MRPFAFMHASGPPPVDYPSTLAATAYLKDWAADPWTGTASAGTSGSHRFIDGIAPVAGPSFGSHPSALFTSAHLNADSFTLQDLIGTGAFSLDFVAEFASAGAPTTDYNEPALFQIATQNFFVTFTSSGVRAGYFTSAFAFADTPVIALATGTKANIQFSYDGTHIKCRVNGGTYSTPVAAAGVYAGSLADTPLLARVISDYSLARLLAFDFDVGDSVRDLLYADAQSFYGVP